MRSENTTAELFFQEILAKRWNNVGCFLTMLLEETSYEDIDRIDFGKPMVISMWVNALIHSKLYNTVAKGRYLFMKLIRSLWHISEVDLRWRLISSVAILFSMSPKTGGSKGRSVMYFVELADLVGLSREDVLETAAQYADSMTANTNRILQ